MSDKKNPKIEAPVQTSLLFSSEEESEATESRDQIGFKLEIDNTVLDKTEPKIVPARAKTKPFSQGQIRLVELSVYNWGSFHGLHTASIDKEGTLITGDNGAGKSTLIDGLMALLLPAGKATFNVAAAQGDKSDRSLLSYMRGSFGTAHDGAATRVKSKREKGVVTGISALYQADDGSYLTLLALFWTTSSSNALSDVKRLYCVAKRSLQLTEVLSFFDEGNTRKLKQFLRDDPDITDCDNNFSDYQTLYRKLLHMDNKNAPALLSRALGLKKIDDLTKLIRELVLEPSSVREDALKVVEEFADLVATHTKLIDAKEQSNHLVRLPELAEIIKTTSEQLTSLAMEKQGLPIYFARILKALFEEKIAQLEQTQIALDREIKQLEVKEQDANALVENRHEAYLSLGGGKIEGLKSEIVHLKSKLNDVIRTASSYQEACVILELNDNLEEHIFDKNLIIAKEKLVEIEQEVNKKRDEFVDIRSHKNQILKRFEEIKEEAQAIIARPDSNIDIRYQKLRDEMIESLSLKSDNVRYIGELIDVKEEERAWQGAIERALGGLKTTLLVTSEDYPLVTRWLNQKHTGLHVRVQVAQLNEKATLANFFQDGYLTKLVWRDNVYRDWLKQFLVKFDLHCVLDTETLNATPFSMTITGLVHHEKGRFEKKDQRAIDDKRAWSLGFSNKSRLLLLNNEQQSLKNQLADIDKQDKVAIEALELIQGKAQTCHALLKFEWEQINAPYWHNRLTQLESDLQVLESSSGNIEQAKTLWLEAKQILQTVQNDKSNSLIRQGALDNDKRYANRQLNQVEALAITELSETIFKLLHKRVGHITLDTAHKQADIDRVLETELEQVRRAKTSAENSANHIMGSFRGKDKWLPLTVDWAVGLEGLEDYVAHYLELEREGLPSLVEQFKERLNKHATQSLARVKTKLESEREEILERIEIINQVLMKTEFKQGSHLRLGSKREKFPHVIEFEKKIRLALSQVTSDDHEGRFKLLADVIEILDKASNSATANTLESLRLLDPRYQMSFYAEEIDSATQEIRDVLESSSGKSGGEKESFAGTIVAASLAYVLTPDGFDKPVYCTVFLDEAFSNTAETVSRRVLKVFKALNIHVNLITPFKNLNLARESARALLIAERDPVMHESRLCEVTWQEMDEIIMKRKESSVKNEAEALGVTLSSKPE
ncbi:ATP-binding protein [Thorsellia anophelis]|uniref:Uncharacterized protein YPO0396 n=1 Tax=Thorsellia anophelis DSM 18579 TaxID=1123402 RepID=A0A1I0F1R5_9GAMM|nr:ATP-binding protein [Thorsellia anophelis]SET50941.1 Uncharacterized protein YPO0396 [Thorsellia anophelis DSM 18579]